MTQQQIERIEEICMALRSEILRGEVNFINSENFPEGCCGNVSQDFLIHRLVAAGFKETVYVNGTSAKYPSHGWLEYQDYIIDITADQFPEITEPVLIVKKEESVFHKQFKLIE
jgi:hypothetical protein